MSEPTLSEALRAAADLCDLIGWDKGITWSGSHTIGLHASDDVDHVHLLVSLPRYAVMTEDTIQRGEDYECNRSSWSCDTGLSVTVYGPHRELSQAVAS